MPKTDRLSASGGIIRSSSDNLRGTARMLPIKRFSASAQHSQQDELSSKYKRDVLEETSADAA